MAPTRFTKPLMAATLLALGVITAGCSHSAAPPAGSAAMTATAPALPRPAVGEIPVVDSTVGRSMPIEAYLYSAEQRRQVGTARDTLTTQCMTRFGLTYTPAAQPAASSRGQATHRYDVVDPANGYRSPEPAPARPAPPQLPPDQLAVLAGAIPGKAKPITTYHGIAIPKGGCLGEAEGKLTAQGGTSADSDLAVNINFDNYQRSMADDRLKAVFQKWSDCMKAKGFSYPTPNDAMNDKRWKTKAATASPGEIATATADGLCRQQANVIGTWFTVESAYETQAIQANLQQLTQVRQGIAAVVRNAGTVNSTGAL